MLYADRPSCNIEFLGSEREKSSVRAGSKRKLNQKEQLQPGGLCPGLLDVRGIPRLRSQKLTNALQSTVNLKGKGELK